MTDPQVASRNHCAYASHCGKGPKCSGYIPTHKVRNYYVGAAKAVLGPDMMLCTAHASWLGTINPFHAIERA